MRTERKKERKKGSTGFSLAEILISVMILGEIATFTIPKLLQSQQNSSNMAKAREVAGVIAMAYQQHQFAGLPNSSTLPKDLSQYMSYVSVYTSGEAIDDRPNATATNQNCYSGTPCIRFHNGGLLWFEQYSFGGTNTTNCITFLFDPDGIYTGNTDSVKFYLYFNGKIVDRNNTVAGSANSYGAVSQISNGSPSWLTW